MGNKSGYQNTSGYLRIAKVTSVNAEKFRCEVEVPGTMSKSSYVNLSPNPTFGVMPQVGSYIYMYDRPGGAKKFLGILDLPDNRTPDQVLALENKRGSVPRMKDGDAYVGHGARAYFEASGNATFCSRGRRANMYLKSEDAVAEVDAYNFDFHSTGNNVRIHSTSSIPHIWGDSLHLEVNTPFSPSNYSELTNTSLGSIRILENGSISIDAQPSGGPIRQSLTMRVNGDISLVRGDNTIGLKMDSTNNLSLFNPNASLLLDNSGNVNISAGKNADISATGNISFSNALSSILISGVDGSVSLQNQTVFNVISPSTVFSGSVTFSSPAGSSAVASGPFNLSTPGFSITSPNTSFSGNTKITGNTEINGELSVKGKTQFTGDVTFAAKINVPGIIYLFPVPFTGSFYRAGIPVFVNGVYAGIIPMI